MKFPNYHGHRGSKRLTASDEDTRARYYQRGWSDDEIARKLGLTRSAIASWRIKRGFVSHPVVLTDVTELDLTPRAKRLYLAALPRLGSD